MAKIIKYPKVLAIFCELVLGARKNLPEHRAELELLVKKTRDVNQRNRVCVVLARDDGHDPETLSHILRISLSSVYDYLHDYDSKAKTKNTRHEGALRKLNLEQELKAHLSKITYQTSRSICAYVEAKYGVRYTPAGMLDWLSRNEFSYKAPKVIPGKLCSVKQAEFIKKYEELKSQLLDDEQIYFMDAVHPEHQSQSVSGWVAKGEIKTLGTTAKQFRLHINGAINLQMHKVFTQEYETIDSQSIISFLDYLKDKNVEANKIHIICDNGRSNKTKELTKYLEKQTKFQVHYLSAYSPNLNPIERLWKLIREYVTYNKVYQNFADFSITINEIQAKLVKRINAGFSGK